MLSAEFTLQISALPLMPPSGLFSKDFSPSSPGTPQSSKYSSEKGSSSKHSAEHWNAKRYSTEIETHPKHLQEHQASPQTPAERKYSEDDSTDDEVVKHSEKPKSRGTQKAEKGATAKQLRKRAAQKRIEEEEAMEALISAQSNILALMPAFTLQSVPVKALKMQAGR